MLKFLYNHIYNSPKANFCIRFNSGNSSPFLDTSWPENAKCVYETEPKYCMLSSLSRGVYACPFGTSADDKSSIVRFTQEPILMLLDYDKEDLIFSSKNEMCLRKANIVCKVNIRNNFGKKQYTILAYAQMFAAQKRLAYSLSRKVKLPDIDLTQMAQQQALESFLTQARDNNPKLFTSMIHGYRHWYQTATMGIYLADETPEADAVVAAWFGFLHDCQRHSEGTDIEHGLRAHDYILQNRLSLFKNLSDKQIYQLSEACKIHTIAKSGDVTDPTIAVCIDADRLQLHRVGLKVDKERLFSLAGKRFLEADEELLEEEERIKKLYLSKHW